VARYIGNKAPLSIARQALAMRELHPRFKARSGGSTIRWRGAVKPNALSAVYEIEVVYLLGKSPKVYVFAPSLVPDDNGYIPHIYADEGDKYPCLYTPGRGEWTDQKLIATTIIPWLSLWLHYYEVWRATGQWLGGGEHPVRSPKKPE